jgi:hypothetical protein
VSRTVAPTGPPAARAVTALLVVTAAGTVAYWVAFFAAGGTLHSSDTDAYLAFERAFPAADAWMATAAISAAVGLARRRSWAVLAGIATGSALVFLGLLDVLFNVEQGLYGTRSGAMAVEVVINVFCLATGPFLLAYFWRSRDRLRA